MICTNACDDITDFQIWGFKKNTKNLCNLRTRYYFYSKYKN